MTPKEPKPVAMPTRQKTTTPPPDVQTKEPTAEFTPGVPRHVPYTPKLAPVNKSRLTFLRTVYYTSPDTDATSLESRYFRQIESNEQPYQRGRLIVGEEWMALDPGWITGEVSLLVIKNEEGQFTQSIPTDEMKKEAESKVIEMGVESESKVIPFGKICAGEDLPVAPIDLATLRIRSRSGKTRYRVSIYPA